MSDREKKKRKADEYVRPVPGSGKPPWHFEEISGRSEITGEVQDMVAVFDVNDGILFMMMQDANSDLRRLKSMASRICLAINSTIMLTADELRNLGVKISQGVLDQGNGETPCFSQKLEGLEFKVVTAPNFKVVTAPNEEHVASTSMGFLNLRESTDKNSILSTAMNAAKIRTAMKELIDTGECPHHKCPGCGEVVVLPKVGDQPMSQAVVDMLRARGYGDMKARDGDMMLCPFCGFLSRVEGDGVRTLTEGELEEFTEREPTMAKHLAEAQKVIRMRG